eukprot:TRINITY_DN103575_c0_g1_i1.p1 TRINITY_DN103575_c0_g1~~TRINITY_DN103575_c0_g1_i1.p1  ORF type:complete len:323 (-),score=54.51 TRINITY_DN103575_c0_g1_i1:69-1037(-)
MSSREECKSCSLEASNAAPQISKPVAGARKATQPEPASSKGSKPSGNHPVAVQQQISAVPSPSRNTSRQQRMPGSPLEVAKTSSVHPCTSPKPEPRASPVRTRRPGTPFPVWLHVYDLGPISKLLVNSWAINSRDSSCLGIFHVGIEVLNVEFSFQAMADCGEDDNITGLTWHNPKSHPRHVYRESVCLGNSALDAKQVGNLLEKLEKEWTARTYHCLTKNCVDFAEHFATCLGAPFPFPKWAHGLAKNLASRDLVPPEPAARFLPCSWGSCSNSQSVGSCSASQSVGSLASFGRRAQDEEDVVKAGDAPTRPQGCSLFSLI